MKFISKTNLLLLDIEKQTAILNTFEYPLKNIVIFEENRIKLQFDKYTVKSKDSLLTLIDNTDASYDTLSLVENIPVNVDDKKIFIIKKDTYITLNVTANSITYEEVSYPVTNVSKKGHAVTVYKCEIGTLEISDSSTRMSKWNGVSIMYCKS